MEERGESNYRAGTHHDNHAGYGIKMNLFLSKVNKTLTGCNALGFFDG